MFHVINHNAIIMPERPGSVSEDPGQCHGLFQGTSVKPRPGQRPADAVTHRIDLTERERSR